MRRTAKKLRRKDTMEIFSIRKLFMRNKSAIIETAVLSSLAMQPE
jgi:hypothetical protein